MRRVALAQQSKRAKKEAVIWGRVKKERIERLRDKFGYVPCEYCFGKVGVGLLTPEGHHNNHRRRDNSAANCRILHRYCNQKIEDLNVKDVLSLL